MDAYTVKDGFGNPEEVRKSSFSIIQEAIQEIFVTGKTIEISEKLHEELLNRGMQP